MRGIGYGGGGVRETADSRMARELSPKEEDKAIDVVAELLPKLLPNMRVEKIKPLNPDESVANKPKFDKFDLLISFGGKPAIGMRATSETNKGARDHLRGEFSREPFVTTPFADEDLPRALIYVDPSYIDGHYMNDPEKEEKLNTKILETFQLSLQFAQTQTNRKEEQKQLQQLLDEVNKKQTELIAASETIH